LLARFRSRPRPWRPPSSASPYCCRLPHRLSRGLQCCGSIPRSGLGTQPTRDAACDRDHTDCGVKRFKTFCPMSDVFSKSLSLSRSGPAFLQSNGDSIVLHWRGARPVDMFLMFTANIMHRRFLGRRAFRSACRITSFLRVGGWN
jgi:hypothetical protein